MTCIHCLEALEVTSWGAFVHERTGSAWCDPARARIRPGYHPASILLLRQQPSGAWAACEAEATEADAAPRP